VANIGYSNRIIGGPHRTIITKNCDILLHRILFNCNEAMFTRSV
jgi:hypothetical protein